MAIVRQNRGLTRIARPVQPSRPVRVTPLPDQTHEIIVRAPQPVGDPDAVAADQRFAKLTAAQLLAELKVQRERSTRGFYAMGLLLRELARPERYKDELGFENFDDLLEQKYMTNRMTALKYITVVSIWNELMATELGIEKSYALIKYASVATKAENAPSLYLANPEIGGEHVHDMSSRDLMRAAKELRAAAKTSGPSDLEQEARRAARLMQAALRKSGARSAVARAQRRAGAWMVAVHLTPAHAAAWAEAM